MWTLVRKLAEGIKGLEAGHWATAAAAFFVQAVGLYWLGWQADVSMTYAYGWLFLVLSGMSAIFFLTWCWTGQVCAPLRCHLKETGEAKERAVTELLHRNEWLDRFAAFPRFSAARGQLLRLYERLQYPDPLAPPPADTELAETLIDVERAIAEFRPEDAQAVRAVVAPLSGKSLSEDFLAVGAAAQMLSTLSLDRDYRVLAKKAGILALAYEFIQANNSAEQIRLRLGQSSVPNAEPMVTEASRASVGATTPPQEHPAVDGRLELTDQRRFHHPEHEYPHWLYSTLEATVDYAPQVWRLRVVCSHPVDQGYVLVRTTRVRLEIHQSVGNTCTFIVVPHCMDVGDDFLLALKSRDAISITKIELLPLPQGG